MPAISINGLLGENPAARAADLSLGAVRDYEQGKREPTLRSAIKLARALGVDLNVLGEELEPDEATSPKRRGKRK